MSKLLRMPWCTSHYRHEFCLQKVKELRASGKYRRVWTGYSIKERNPRTGELQKFSKIYVEFEE